MSDILREIDDELQRERMAALWHRYKYAITTVIALIILGTASYSAWRTHRDNAEIARSVALGAVVGDAKATDAAKLEAFTAFARSNAGTGQGVLAQMTAAGLAVKSGKRSEAVQMLQTLAADAKAPPIARDYARLVIAEIQLDDGDPAELQRQLAPLAAEGQPWRHTARMLQGVLHAKQGDRAKAKSIFEALGQDEDAPVTLRDEARILARYYGTLG